MSEKEIREIEMFIRDQEEDVDVRDDTQPINDAYFSIQSTPFYC